MRINNDMLKEVVDNGEWMNLQKQIAIVSGITTHIIDSKGDSVTDYSIKNSFCASVMNDPKLGVLCKKCKSRGALEAIQRNKSYIHLCPFDLIEISVPILIEEEYLGSIAGGQVALLIPEASEHLEHLVENRGQMEFLKELDNKDLYLKTNKMKCTDIIAATRMISSIRDYLVSYFLKPIIYNENRKDEKVEFESYVQNETEFNGKRGENKAYNSFYDNEVPEQYEPKNYLLKPVFKYLFANKGENVPLTDAATLCHISTCYFSRLFAKELGINYSQFVNQLKIQWAKELLDKTDFSVIRISSELGYNDSTYFIKTFKRYEGVTPTKYRRED